MTNERDPIHWEKLVHLDAAALKTALDECAKNHLGWAIDQARILYYHTQPGSAQAQVVTAFALDNIELAAAADIDTALQAWQLGAKEESADAEKAGQAFGKLLLQISQTDMRRAWDIASVALASDGDHGHGSQRPASDTPVRSRWDRVRAWELPGGTLRP